MTHITRTAGRGKQKDGFNITPWSCPSLICPLLICTTIATDGCADSALPHPFVPLRHSNAPTVDDSKVFLSTEANPWKGEAAATSSGTLRQHLHSRPDLNDHSSQWENFNGAPGRKEAASSLILGTLHLRWNAGKKAARRRGEAGKFSVSHFSRLSASCLPLTIITPCIRHERGSLIALWFSESSLPLLSCSQPCLSLSPFLQLSLSFSPPSPIPPVPE